MAKPSPALPDRAIISALAGTFGANATSAAYPTEPGAVNVTLTGTWSGTVTLCRSFDGGTTLAPYATPDGTALSWTAAMSTMLPECEAGVLWYLVMSSFASGSCAYRISQ